MRPLGEHLTFGSSRGLCWRGALLGARCKAVFCKGLAGRCKLKVRRAAAAP